MKPGRFDVSTLCQVAQVGNKTFGFAKKGFGNNRVNKKDKEKGYAGCQP